MSQGRAGPARNDYLLARYLLLIIGVTLLVFALLVIARLGVFYSLYTWLFGEVFAVTGFDLWFSRAITLGLLVVLWYFGGHLVVMTWIGERRKRLAIIIGATALALVAMELATRNVYFSRADGSPAKYYIRTLDGYKFSASPGTDPVHGVPYRPMTAQVAREYLLWKKRGGKIQDPEIPEDQYFSPATGDPVRWYADLPNGQIEMFTLPGFHPKHSTKLLPVTPEIVAKYEKQKAQQAAKRQARAKANHKLRFQPGRYIFGEPRPGAVVGHLRFILKEVNLTADSMVIHLELEQLATVMDWFTQVSIGSQASKVTFGLIRADGRVIRPRAGWVTDGPLSYRNHAIAFQYGGHRGWLAQEFPPLEDRQLSFSPTINDYPVFGSISLRRAKFRSF